VEGRDYRRNVVWQDSTGKRWNTKLPSSPKKKILKELRSKTQRATFKYQYNSNISGDSCVVYTAFKDKAVTINQEAATFAVENQAW
jgi:hypothetical protein